MNLHITLADKFVPEFILFASDRLQSFHKHNRFWVGGHRGNFNFPVSNHVTFYKERNPVSAALGLARSMNQADKIFLHGLFWNRIIIMLALQPWLLRKTHWIIWGGDLYTEGVGNSLRDRTVDCLKKRVIRKIGHLVSYIDEDIELARYRYHNNGKQHKCIVYPSNLFKTIDGVRPKDESSRLKVLVGNSATKSNHHLEVFDEIRGANIKNFQIICPLSYGDTEYANEMNDIGIHLFGDAFTGILELMDKDDYYRLLCEVDIAVFNHDRQQAMGNIISLLGFGKKVYLRATSPQYRFFANLGIKVFDIKEIDLAQFSEHQRESNISLIKSHFSERVLTDQLSKLLSASIK